MHSKTDHAWTVCSTTARPRKLRRPALHPRFPLTALSIAVVGALAGCAGCGITDASHVVPVTTTTSVGHPTTDMPTAGSSVGTSGASASNAGTSAGSTTSGPNGGGAASAAGAGGSASPGLDDQTLNELGAALGAVDNSVNASGSDLSNPQGDN